MDLLLKDFGDFLLSSSEEHSHRPQTLNHLFIAQTGMLTQGLLEFSMAARWVLTVTRGYEKTVGEMLRKAGGDKLWPNWKTHVENTY